MLAGDDAGEPNHSWWQNGLSLLAVYAIGIAAWLVSYLVGVWDADESIVPPPLNDDEPHTVGMVLGYISAAFYLWLVSVVMFCW